MNSPEKPLEGTGQQKMEVIRRDFREQAIETDSNASSSIDEKLEGFHELLTKYEAAVAKIPLKQDWEPDADFDFFFNRVLQKVDHLRRTKSGSRGWPRN